MVDEEGRLTGIFTDADLRRHLEGGGDFLDRPLKEVMTANPRSAPVDCLAVEVLEIMRKHEIDELPIVDERGVLVGMVDVQDLLAAGLVWSIYEIRCLKRKVGVMRDAMIRKGILDGDSK